MKKNWDDDGNWVGDDIPDSTRDWGVEADSSASFDECVGVIRACFFVVSIRILWFAIPVGLIVLLVLWLVGMI